MVVDVRTDFHKVHYTLEVAGLEIGKIQKKILTGVGTKAKNAAKRAYGATLQKRTGRLHDSLIRVVSKSGEKVSVYSPAARNTQSRANRYGFILASGARILPKAGKVLTFKVDGRWVRSHGVTVPARDWIAPAIQAYLNSPTYSNDINRTLDKEIKKIFEKEKEQQ